MTKKDFQALADAIKEALAEDVRIPTRRGVKLTAEKIAQACQRANPRFDAARFYAACGL